MEREVYLRSTQKFKFLVQFIKVTFSPLFTNFYSQFIIALCLYVGLDLGEYFF